MTTMTTFVTLSALTLFLVFHGNNTLAMKPGSPSSIHQRFMIAQDAIPHPPQLRHIVSPNGSYHLTLIAHLEDSFPRTRATLSQNLPDRCQQVWAQILPQNYGPRLALVTDRGDTLLLDEWINVASPYAIVMLDASGEIVGQYSFDDIVAISGRTRASVVERAQQGFWIAGEPTLKPPNLVEVPTAGATLAINLTTGEISF